MKNLTDIFGAPEPAFCDAIDLQVNAYNNAFEERGITVFNDPNHYKKLTLEKYAPLYGQKGDLIMSQVLGKSEIDDEVRALVELKQKHYDILIKNPGDLVKIMPGALKLMDEIHAKDISFNFVSSGKLYVVESLINYMGVRDKVNTIITGDDVVYGKPNPGLYFKALSTVASKKKDFSIKNCLTFEGTLPGVQSATAAGIPVIVVSGDKPTELFEKEDPYMTIKSLEELFPKKFYEIIDDFKK